MIFMPSRLLQTIFILCLSYLFLFFTGCRSTVASPPVELVVVRHLPYSHTLRLIPFACQEKLMKMAEIGEDNYLGVTFFIDIRNHSDFVFAFGAECYSFGYNCLELDIKTPDGKLHCLKKRPAVWYKNLLWDEIVPAHESRLYPVALDPRIWDGVPLLEFGDKIFIRPRFAFWVFKKDEEPRRDKSQSYRTIEELLLDVPMGSSNMKRSWKENREGELVGEWTPFTL